MVYALSEFESKQLLSAAGIRVPAEHLVRDAESAVSAADALGYPVALKLCGRGIAHKTERGLVSLGVSNADTVLCCAEQLLSRRRPDEGGAGILVSPMISGRRELIAGMLRDQQFGPCVMFGLGGIFAETLDDVAFAVAPLEPGDAEELLEALANAKILGEFRGEPGVNRRLLATVLETLGKIGLEQPDVVSIDINPLIVSGSEPIVIDALVELTEEPA